MARNLAISNMINSCVVFLQEVNADVACAGQVLAADDIARSLFCCCSITFCEWSCNEMPVIPTFSITQLSLLTTLTQAGLI